MPKTQTMRQRFAAQSIIEQLLLEQSILTPRSPAARLLGRSPIGADNATWYVGAKAEIAVGALLAALPPTWTVFHALPVGTVTADIDHLVVGPGGVFTVTTKSHQGKRVWVSHRIMMVGGEKMPYIRNSEFEAERVTRLLRQKVVLRGSVRPVVALVGTRHIGIQEKPAQVKVIDAVELVRWFTSLPPVLTATECAELATIIDNPDTWSTPISSGEDDLMERFTALDAEVRVARYRRFAWSVLGGATSIGVGIAAVSALVTGLLGFLAYAGG